MSVSATTSAASAVKPPAKTPSDASTRCWSAVSNAIDASRTAVMSRCLGSTVAVRDDSSSGRLRSCSVGDLTCDQAARSSIASGSPPTRRHSSVTASVFLGERCVAHSGGAVGEQLAALRQWRQGIQPLVRRGKRHPARGQDGQRLHLDQQRVDELPTGDELDLAVVEHQHRRLVAERVDDANGRISTTACRQTQGHGNPTRHITRAGRCGEVDPHAVVIADQLRRQPRLPGPAQTHHGDKSTRLKQTAKRGDLGTPPNEPGRIARRPAHAPHPPDHAQTSMTATTRTDSARPTPPPRTGGTTSTYFQPQPPPARARDKAGDPREAGSLAAVGPRRRPSAVERTMLLCTGKS